MFLKLLKNELFISYRSKNTIFTPAGFFIITFFLFPFLIGSEPETLQKFFNPIVIICTVFVIILSSFQIFDQDLSDGFIEQKLSSGISPLSIFLSKLLNALIIILFPMIFSIIIAGIICDIEFANIFNIIILLGIALPILVSISLFVSLLASGMARASVISSLITLPFNLPVLVLVSLASQRNEIFWNYIKLLAGLELTLLPIVLFLSSILIKNIANTTDSH